MQISSVGCVQLAARVRFPQLKIVPGAAQYFKRLFACNIQATLHPGAFIRLLFSAERCSETFIRAKARLSLSLSPTPPSGQKLRPRLASVFSKSHKRSAVSGTHHGVKRHSSSAAAKNLFCTFRLALFHPPRCTNIFARRFYEHILLGARAENGRDILEEKADQKSCLQAENLIRSRLRIYEQANIV